MNKNLLDNKLFLSAWPFYFLCLSRRTAYLRGYACRGNAGQKYCPLNKISLLTLDLQDTSLRDTLKMLSVQSGMNFIASEAVAEQ